MVTTHPHLRYRTWWLRPTSDTDGSDGNETETFDGGGSVLPQTSPGRRNVGSCTNRLGRVQEYDTDVPSDPSFTYRESRGDHLTPETKDSTP